MSSTNLENVEPHPLRADTFALDIELSKPHGDNSSATDYYEILRVGPQADEDTIERVYRTLADRFHPDNPSTGDPETYLRLREAYETLSNQTRRATYNVSRQNSRGSTRFWLRGREFFDGVRGGQNRRLAVLCLLYRQRISRHEAPGLTALELEQQTGCTREEVTSALWYLREKQWAAFGEFTTYHITAEGFDFVESKLEDRLEFRALATTCYYRSAPELDSAAHTEPRFKKDALPLDIQPAITSEVDASVADHYEILGIGPHADEETIGRVYRTLAGRFHPDNPSTGDPNTFRRIREAYDTLSDEDRRAQYNALRQRTKNSERFRLRGREFFDGIKGEQLRRLAVLCLLYRQAASELPGLTVLDLEQLTGCTREELSPSLWYLREKKWAASGEFTEYSITAAGFDVVENKLDEREAARSRAWLVPEETRGKQFAYPQLSAPQGAQHQSEENVKLIQTEIEKASGNGEIAPLKALRSWFGGKQQDVPVTPQSPIQAEEPREKNPEEIRLETLRQRFGNNRQSIPVTPPPDTPLPTDTPLPPEESGPEEPVVAGFENRADAQVQEGAETQTRPAPEEAHGNESVSPPAEVAQPVEQSQSTVKVTPQSSAVTVRSNSKTVIAEPAAEVAISAAKRVVFSMGGKGGVGKTSVMTGLAEWYEENRIPVTLLDLDTENKAMGSLTHFFGGRVPKINIYTPAGLDAFVDHLGEDTPVVLADMGAGAGYVTHDWFDKMYPDVAETGVAFTAIGVVTSDPASVESILNWATALQGRVNYVIVENKLTEHSDFTYWQEGDQAQEFQKRFRPAIVRLDNRLADLENAARNYGFTLGRIAGRTTGAAELQKASLVMRAQSYRRRMFAEFDKVKELLLP
jgi:curved DNA-binding protein CbpA/MinD-like ATPase involved in chromosome partitioning or flagellar assembly